MIAPPTLERLRADLLAARNAQDGLKTATLQSVLARVTNAEAIPLDPKQSASEVNIGVGSTEVPRRVLSEQDIALLVQDEIDELRDAVASMAAHAESPYVVELKQKIQILQDYAPTR